MGNFLVVLSSCDLQSEAERLFRFGLVLTRRIKSQTPNCLVETDWAHAASFARQNGSGTPIVSEPETGSWLLAIGTWFHTDDYGVGTERRLLSRYLEVGPVRLARELEGFFVVVIGDARVQEIVILTDIVGSCHCFVRTWKRIVALSGSSLLLAGLGGFNLDPIGCQEFLSTGIIYEDRTLYREVRKLGPATVFRFSASMQESQQRYWQITDIASESLDGRPAIRALGETLTCAAQKVGHSFTHPVCDLTGGYDSRSVVAAFLTAGVHFSTTVSGPDDSSDVTVSRGLAQVAGVSHLHITVPRQPSFAQIKKALCLTDGEYNLIEYARILDVHQTLLRSFDISINGSFGEVARGYWWELLFPRVGACCKLEARRLAKLRYAAQRFDTSLFPPETRLDLVSHLTSIIEKTTAGLSHLPNTLQMDHTYLAMRMQRWQGRIASSTNQLWPCLSLFLFRSVLETMLRTTTRLRRRSLLIRRMLAEFQPRLAEFPLEHGYPASPVRWTNFHRFAPVLGYYGKKILSRIAHKFKGNQMIAVSPESHCSLRMQLWYNEEIRDCLQPKSMNVGCLIATHVLSNFLEHSRQQDFPFNDQWERLLSLEYALNILTRTKMEVGYES